MRLKFIGLFALATLAVTACDEKGVAYGDANSVIAVMSPDLWAQVSDDVYGALEQTIRTVRDEKTFTVTYQDPAEPEWGNLRRFRQMLLVGTESEPWVAEALAAAREPITEPGMAQVYDVWSRGQNVTLILLSEEGAVDELRSSLPEVHELLDEQYRQYARSRMYQTGVDTALADTLMGQARFSLLVPVVYRWQRTDSTYLFRNDNPDPSELIREIAVTWKSPIPTDMQPEGILDWRTETVAQYSTHPQDMDISNAVARPFMYRGVDAYEIQAMWVNPPDLNWPAAGPSITRAIVCPDQNRMYLLDAWLYAPDREKYEYMIQLETILDTFRCGVA